MDNLSLENESTEEDRIEEEAPPISVSAEGEDIEFDENIDINEIQKQLNAHMQDFENVPDIEPEFFDTSSSTNNEKAETSQQQVVPAIENVPIEIDPKSKKYVIYIDPENIDFMEALSINDRKTIINKILREQDEAIAAQLFLEQRKRFLRQIIVATLTFIIGFPLLFALVNLSMEATITNYKQSKKDFSVLYRENGKIQQKNARMRENIKY